MNRFFVDSNIFIETFKKEGLEDALEIWKWIEKNYEEKNFYINAIVKSEVSYHLFFKKKLFDIEDLKSLFLLFESLSINKKIEKLMLDYIQKYNLRPNDALILATCKFYNIDVLLSLDIDFEKPCQQENINFVNKVEKLQKE